MKTKVAGLTFDTKQDALDFFRSGLKTLEGKGKQPTKGGLFDKSAPERRREAQIAMEAAVRAYVQASHEEGTDPTTTIECSDGDGIYVLTQSDT
jgi:hypothetical protein